MSKLPRPNVITSDWINRNHKRLVTNIKEINRQIEDIENAWELSEHEMSKYDRQRRDDLYSDYQLYNNQLEELKEIERNYRGN